MKIDANNFLAHHIKNNIPCAVGKIGTSELNILYNYIQQPNEIFPEIKKLAEYNAGVYPLTLDNLKKYSELFLESIKCLNVAPRWNNTLQSFEQSLLNKYTTSYDCNLIDLEPQWFERPWTEHLKDKTVLVISPFADTIKKQYQRKELIWPNNILPNFNLITIKHPHASLIDEHTTPIFDILTNIQTQIDKYEFDICIIGTGGTSIPLTSYVYNKNKIAIHLGGPTQILFGIKGKRWDDRENYQKIYNEYWVRPDIHETPKNNSFIEGGCYW
jgi:hypothetical protein